MLLVDDDAAVLKRASEFLSTEFEIAGFATDGAEAFDAIERLAPDVIVMGVANPVLDGIQTARRLRSSGTRSRSLFCPQCKTRFTIHVLVSVAEHEAEMISTRTKVALAAAKRKGVVLGGDRGNTHLIYHKGARQSAKVRSEQAQRRTADLLPVIEALKAEGAASLRDIAAGLNQRGIPIARGGE